MTDAPPADAGRRLLVVDDVPDLAAVILRQLSRAGFSPVYCPTIEEAARRLAKETYACAVIDLYFGLEPRGWDLLKIIRSDLNMASLPVVSMSGSGPDVLEKCLDHGADAILAKPFILPELLEAVERAIAARRTAN